MVKVHEVRGAECGDRDTLWRHFELEQEDAAALLVPIYLGCFILPWRRKSKVQLVG